MRPRRRHAVCGFLVQTASSTLTTSVVSTEATASSPIMRIHVSDKSSPPLLPVHGVAPPSLMGRNVTLGTFSECHLPRSCRQRLLARRSLVIERVYPLDEQASEFQALRTRFGQTNQRTGSQPNVPATALPLVLALVPKYPAAALLARNLEIDAVAHGVASRAGDLGDRQGSKGARARHLKPTALPTGICWKWPELPRTPRKASFAKVISITVTCKRNGVRFRKH